MKIETINNSSKNNQKDYKITLSFLEKTIIQLGERNLQLLIDDILFDLFNKLDLVFFATIEELSSVESSLKQSSIIVSGSITTLSLTTTTFPLCVTSNVTILGKYTYPSLYVAPGATLTLNGNLIVNGSFINEGTINGNHNISISVNDSSSLCSNIPTAQKYYYTNSGTIDLCGGGSFQYNSSGSNFINEGTITASLYSNSITNQNDGKTNTC